MKFTVIALFCMIAFAQACQQGVNCPTDPFGDCIKEIKTAAYKLTGSATPFIQKDYLEGAKLFLRAAADGIEAYQGCQGLTMSDFLVWLDRVLTPEQSKCVSNGISVGLAIATAKGDPTPTNQ